LTKTSKISHENFLALEKTFCRGVIGPASEQAINHSQITIFRRCSSASGADEKPERQQQLSTFALGK
jgi:hypothetical protein